LYERALASTRYQVVPARSAAAALAALEVVRPVAIILDIRLHGEDAWDLLARLKRSDDTRSIPLIVSSTLDDQSKGFALGADAYGVKPINREWVVRTLQSLAPSEDGPTRVLSVDDEEASRYIIREMLNDSVHQVIEASSGEEGLVRARALVPDVILLDVRLTDMSGIDALERLREDPNTAGVPVVMVTSQTLSADDRRRLGRTRVLSKGALTRDVLKTAIREAASPADRTP
jgi:CheY-like chemotaxis protein